MNEVQWLEALQLRRGQEVGSIEKLLERILDEGKRATIKIEVVHEDSERLGVDVLTMGDWEQAYHYVIPEGPPR